MDTHRVKQLLSISLLASTLACATNTEYIYHGDTAPEGSVTILTNKKIPVVIQCATGEVTTKLNVGGWYAVPVEDMAGIVEALKEIKE